MVKGWWAQSARARACAGLDRQSSARDDEARARTCVG